MYLQRSILITVFLVIHVAFRWLSWDLIIASRSIWMFDIINMLLDIETLIWNIVLDLYYNVIHICVPTFNFHLPIAIIDLWKSLIANLLNYGWNVMEMIDCVVNYT